MTNQQKMCELSPEEFWDKMMWLINKYGRRYNHTQLAVIEWLKSDKDFEDPKFVFQEDKFKDILNNMLPYSNW